MERTLGSCRQGLMACSQDVGEDWLMKACGLEGSEEEEMKEGGELLHYYWSKKIVMKRREGWKLICYYGIYILRAPWYITSNVCSVFKAVWRTERGLRKRSVCILCTIIIIFFWFFLASIVVFVIVVSFWTQISMYARQEVEGEEESGEK